MIVRDVIEIDEAIEAGERVLDRIDEALSYLKDARNWGIFDLISERSIISSMIKHSKLDRAEDVMYELRYDIERFNDELDDVDLPELPEIKMNELMRFVDIFMDNAFSDVMALSHISESRKQLNLLAEKVEDILFELKDLREAY